MAGLRLHRDIDPLCACACNGATDTTFTHPTGLCINTPVFTKTEVFRTSGVEAGFCDDNFLIDLGTFVTACKSGQPQRCPTGGGEEVAVVDNCTFSVVIDGYVGSTGELNVDDGVYITGIYLISVPTTRPYHCGYIGKCAATITGVWCLDETCYKITTWMVCDETVDVAPCISRNKEKISCVKYVGTPFLNQVVDLDFFQTLFLPVQTGFSSIAFGSEDDVFTDDDLQ